MNEFQRAAGLLPERLKKALEARGALEAEEIRLRAGRHPTLIINGEERSFSSEKVTPEELSCILERATGASLHAVRQALQEGYVSWQGLRIGICGTVVCSDGRADGFRTISSLAIRIPKECKGLCDSLAAAMYPCEFENTLILSPPGGGKTTALRDMIRCLSERGYRVAIADERNEISGAEGARARFDLGPHADVMVGLNKAEAGILLLRAMNPQILAMDEITKDRDIDAIELLLGCGVGLLATAHASCVGELRQRAQYRRLLSEKYFRYALTIQAAGGSRSYRVERV